MRRQAAWRSRRARAAAPTVGVRISANRSAIDMSSHSPLNRTLERSGSSTVSACSLNVRALASISAPDQHRAGARAAAGIADPGRVVADDQHDRVAEVLELAQLLEHDREAEVDVRRGRVDPELDPQRPAERQLRSSSPSGRQSTAFRASHAAASAGSRRGIGRLMDSDPRANARLSRRRRGTRRLPPRRPFARVPRATAASSPDSVGDADAPTQSDRMSDDDRHPQRGRRAAGRRSRSKAARRPAGGRSGADGRGPHQAAACASCGCSLILLGLGALALDLDRVRDDDGGRLRSAADREPAGSTGSAVNSYLYDDHWRPIGIFAPPNARRDRQLTARSRRR